MQRLWQDTPPCHGSHLVQGQQWAQQVQLAGREEWRWMVEEVTAVSHRQQCLEETQPITSSWLQTLSLGQQENGSETPEAPGTRAEVQRPGAALPCQVCSSSAAGLGYWLPKGSFSSHRRDALSPAALQRGPHDVPRAQRPSPAGLGQ